MKWKIEIDVPKESDAIKYLEALTEVFKVSAKFKEPLHHAFLQDKNKSLTCTVDPYPKESKPPR